MIYFFTILLSNSANINTLIYNIYNIYYIYFDYLKSMGQIYFYGTIHKIQQYFHQMNPSKNNVNLF